MEMDVPAHCYSTDNAGIMWLLKWLGVNMHHCNPSSPLPVLEIEYKDQSRSVRRGCRRRMVVGVV